MHIFKYNDFWEILAKGNSGKNAAFQKSETWWNLIQFARTTYSNSNK